MLVYLAVVVVIVTRLLIAELLIGRRGQASPLNAMKNVAIESGVSTGWQLFGWMGMFALFLILSFYSVIAGWTMAYIGKALSGSFASITSSEAEAVFSQFRRNPIEMMAWSGLFMVMTVIVVAKGLHKGIERAVFYLMPALFIILIILLIYALLIGDVEAAIDFLFTPKLENFNGMVILSAIGQAFFSVSIGVGGIMTYAAYVGTPINLARTAILISSIDTIVALLAGLIIFPLVFAFGFDPSEAAGLIFVTLPIAFAGMPFGSFFAVLFFTLLFFAALTTAIALIEPIILWGVEFRKWRRRSTEIVMGVLIWLFGFLTVISFNMAANFYPLDFLTIFKEKTLFALIDYLVTSLLVPLGGIIIAVFVGWRVSKKILDEELGISNQILFMIWHWIVKYLAPLAVLGVLIAHIL